MYSLLQLPCAGYVGPMIWKSELLWPMMDGAIGLSSCKVPIQWLGLSNHCDLIYFVQPILIACVCKWFLLMEKKKIYIYTNTPNSSSLFFCFCKKKVHWSGEEKSMYYINIQIFIYIKDVEAIVEFYFFI